jgi:hypothetical protein
MPVRMMAVIDVSKHLLVGLITDQTAACQWSASQNLQDLS